MRAEELGKRIRYLRAQAGLAQYQLAQRAGISPHTISRLEIGRQTAGAVTVHKIAAALGITIEEFYGKKQPPENSHSHTSYISNTFDLDDYSHALELPEYLARCTRKTLQHKVFSLEEIREMEERWRYAHRSPRSWELEVLFRIASERAIAEQKDISGQETEGQGSDE